MLSCTVNCCGTRLQRNRAGEMARNPCPRGKEAPSRAFPLCWQRPSLGLVTLGLRLFPAPGCSPAFSPSLLCTTTAPAAPTPHTSSGPWGGPSTAPRSQITSPAVFEPLKGTAGTQFSPSAAFKSLLLCQPQTFPSIFQLS